MPDESPDNNKSDKPGPGQDIADIPNVDELLSQASDSIAEMGSELGAETEPASAEGKPPTTSKEADVALQELQEHTKAISDEVAQDDDAQASAVAESATDTEGDAEVNSVLADLANELEELNAPAASQDDAGDKADAGPQDITEVDDVLADLSEEIDKLEQQEQDTQVEEEPQNTTTEQAEAGAAVEEDADEADGQMDTAAQEQIDSPSEDEEEETQQDSIEDIAKMLADAEAGVELEEAGEPDAEEPAVEGETVEAEQTEEDAQEEAGIEPPADGPVDEPVDENNDVVMEELAEQQRQEEQVAATTKQEKERPKSPYGSLPRSQRVAAEALTAANKPFGFLDDASKDVLGVVAVVTSIITVLAAGLFLLLR